MANSEHNNTSKFSQNTKGWSFQTIVRNNVIVDTQKRVKDPDGTGYAVINNLPETHTIMMENNCLYNNSGGTYKNTSSTTDIYVDPLVINPNKHDYRLKLNSSCIGTGYPSSDSSRYSGENGNQTNIGRYG